MLSVVRTVTTTGITSGDWAIILSVLITAGGVMWRVSAWKATTDRVLGELEKAGQGREKRIERLEDRDQALTSVVAQLGDLSGRVVRMEALLDRTRER